MMLVSGSQLLYGRRLGKDPLSVQSVFSVDLLISAAASVLVTAALAAGVLMGGTASLTADPTERKMLDQYLLGQCIGIPALVLGQQLFAFLSLEKQTRRTMIASIASFAVNAVFDYLCIIPLNLGAFGLGLSSSISVLVFFGIQAAYYLKGKSELKLSLRECRWKDAPEILRLGYSGALSRFVEMFRCIVVNMLIMTHVGSAGISSFAASNSLLGVVWALPFGMLGVSRMLFSISIGEEDRRSLIDTLHIALFRGGLLMTAVAAALVLCAEPLTRLFFRDPADPVYGYTVMGFRMMPLCMPLAVLSLHFACYAPSTEKRALSIVLPIVDGFASVSAMSLVLIPQMHMNGLYLANILNGFVCAAVIVCFAWLSLKRPPRTLEDLMMIPDSFGVGAGQRIDISVRQMTEVMDVSRRIIDFCRSHSIDERRAMFAGLAMEEMAGNVVTHGFSKDSRTHSADIRVVHKGGGMILRIRDDCAPFNPSEQLRIMEPEDPIGNLGIRVVYGMAKDIQYRNLLGLNVLTIRI